MPRHPFLNPTSLQPDRSCRVSPWIRSRNARLLRSFRAKEALLTSTREPASDLSTISVTPAAKDAIRQLTAANGELLFHLPGGCCDARTPICLPAGELQLGPRDALVGYAEDIPVYEMTDGKARRRKSYRLFVTDGMPKGFSLSPGDGKTFALLETSA